MTMASLSASLLARKGQARPAARPSDPMPKAPTAGAVREMFPPKRPQLVQARPPQATPVKAAQPEERVVAEPPKGKARKTGRRARKTLRLAVEKNRRLRLLAAHLGVSQQALMEKAVSTLLEKELGQGECICGAVRSPTQKS